MKKLLLAALLCVVSSVAWAQNPQCPDRPNGDSTNACANTRFVQNAQSTVSVISFGAKCDGVITNVAGNGVITATGTDDTAAFNTAMNDATVKTVRVPDGKTCIIAGTIAMTIQGQPTNGKILMGGGRGSSFLVSTNTNLPLITVASNVLNVSIRSLSILRTGIAVAGGNGIEYLGAANYGILDDLTVTNHWIGYLLGPNGYGLFQNSRAANNQSHGVSIFAIPGGALQWQLNQIIADSNGGDGFRVDTSGGTGTTAIGNWTGLSTFGNTGAGIRILGASGKKLASFRLTNAFMGCDGGGGIYMDTWDVLPDAQQPHELTQVFNEGSGLCVTGPLNNQLGPTNNVPGFRFTANVGLVQVVNSFTRDNARDGFLSAAAKIIFTNTVSMNNGVSLTAGERNGFSITAGSAQITGGMASNDPSSATQLYGLNIGAGAAAGIFTDNDLSWSSGNATAGCLISSVTIHITRNNKGCTNSPADQTLNMNLNSITQIGSAIWNGATSGTVTVTAPNIAGSSALTWPVGTDTLVGKATTDIFTNKTYNTAGTGNVFQINGNGIAAISGSGNTVLLSVGPLMTTPTLGVASATSINFGGTALSTYLEGTWTPTDASISGLTFAAATGNYTRIGRMVFAYGQVTYPAVGVDTNPAKIGGLPVTPLGTPLGRQCQVGARSESTLSALQLGAGVATFDLVNNIGTGITNQTMSNDLLWFICIYPSS